MNRKGYLPVSDADKVIWLNNFATKIQTYAANLGVTAAEVTSIKNDAAYFSYVENLLEASKQTTNNIVHYRNLLKTPKLQQHLGALPVMPNIGASPVAVSEGILERVSRVIARIKASLNYTDNIGQDLGIIAPTKTVDLINLQPILKIQLDAGFPRIKCNKSVADGLDLYVDRNDGQGFIFVKRLFVLDYTDETKTSAIAEWRYNAMFVIGNKNVGIMSTEFPIIVKK